MFRCSWRWLAGAVLPLYLGAPVAAQVVIPLGSSLDVAGGIMNLGCIPLDMQGSLHLGNGILALDTNATFGSNSDVTGSGGTISIGGNIVASGTLDTGNNTLVLRDGCNAGNSIQLGGIILAHHLVLQSTTGRTFVLPEGARITALDSLTLQGTAAQPLQLTSSAGTAIVNLGPNAAVTRNFANVPAHVRIGAAAPAPKPVPAWGNHGAMLLSLLLGAIALWRRDEHGARRSATD